MTLESDPHEWLRDSEDPAVTAFLEDENAATTRALARNEPLAAEIYDEIKGRVKETDLSVPVNIDGWLYYSRTEEGKSYPVHCRKRAADSHSFESDSVEELILDENVEAGDAEYFDLGVFEVSPNHKLLLWGTDVTGAERFSLKIRNLETGQDTDLPVSDASYGSAWAMDNETFFTVRSDESDRPFEIVRHSLDGSVASETVYSESDGRYFVSVGRERDDSFIYVTTSSNASDEVWMMPANQPTSALRCFKPREEGLEYGVAHHGDQFYVLTNIDDATNFKICQTPETETGSENWKDLVAERPDVMIAGFETFESHLVLYVRADGMTQIRLMNWGGGAEQILGQSEPLYSTWPGLNLDPKLPFLRFGYGSMITPASVMTYDFETGERKTLKQTEVLGGYDPELYETLRLWATADDGTRIPISYIQRKDRQPGPGPCVLYGYGAYEVSIDPAFSIARLSLLDRGFGFAIAHVRGGGELGREWWLSGKLENKQNTFTDFVTCARYLIESGITKPEGLCIRGASAGGLLVGAVLNLSPELFGAAVAEVPFVDVLNTMSDVTLPLTETEWDEWGNPLESDEIYQRLRSYSPYDNVGAKDYPPVLATGGFSDQRVGYWEPAKWVLALREKSTSQAEFLLWTELGAGHGGPSGRYAAWADESRTLAFIVDQVGESINSPFEV